MTSAASNGAGEDRPLAWPGDPEQVSAADIDFEALAHVLANTCRRSGRMRQYPLAGRACGRRERGDRGPPRPVCGGPAHPGSLHALIAGAASAWLREQYAGAAMQGARIAPASSPRGSNARSARRPASTRCSARSTRSCCGSSTGWWPRRSAATCLTATVAAGGAARVPAVPAARSAPWRRSGPRGCGSSRLPRTCAGRPSSGRDTCRYRCPRRQLIPAGPLAEGLPTVDLPAIACTLLLATAVAAAVTVAMVRLTQPDPPRIASVRLGELTARFALDVAGHDSSEEAAAAEARRWAMALERALAAVAETHRMRCSCRPGPWPSGAHGSDARGRGGTRPCAAGDSGRRTRPRRKGRGRDGAIPQPCSSRHGGACGR